MVDIAQIPWKTLLADYRVSLELLNRKVGWDTIYNNLERLRDESKIQKQIMAQFTHKKAYVYVSE